MSWQEFMELGRNFEGEYLLSLIHISVQRTLENNGGVGIMTGYYDQNLSILSVSNLLLRSTGYTFDTFMEQTKGSLRNFFYDEEDILERDRFLQLHGTGEARCV